MSFPPLNPKVSELLVDYLWFILIGVYGLCVGSFLNVVVYRLPTSQSIVNPPSFCPGCKHHLAIWENVPVLAWFFLGGKCSHCKTKISFQYPAIEALTGLLFVGVAWVYYQTNLNPAFATTGLVGSWPVLLVHLVLLASLLAATLIDAKYYIIPLGIPYVAALVALVVYPVFAWRMPDQALAVLDKSGLIPQAAAVRIGLGGVVGLGVGIFLLFKGLIPCSFADEEQWIQQQQQENQTADSEFELQTTPPPEPPESPESPDVSLKTFSDSSLEEKVDDESEADPGAEKNPGEVEDALGQTPIDPYLRYPFARREMFKEILFLLFPLAGMVLGFFLVPISGVEVGLPLRVVGGVLLGYFSGGAVIWMTRILGTLAFGKEAMGLGDVHLLASVGAVLGAVDPLLIFFIAPFFGLAAALICFGLSRIYAGQARVIPYGPYLAGATLLVMLFRTPILQVLF